MNCQEYRDMIEDALDISLHGELEMRVRRHLEHCEGCRAYFVRRRSEHVSLFTSVNAAYSHLRPPSDGFADRIVREVVARRNARWSWRRIALPRWALIAASLVLMAGFVFAATVVVDAVTANDDDREGAVKTEETPADTESTAVVAYDAASLYVDDATIMPSVSSDGIPSATDKQPLVANAQIENQTQKGEKRMTIREKTVAALAAAATYCVALVTTANAEVYTWTGAASGVWNKTDANWDKGVWVDGNIASFPSGVSAKDITLGADVTASGVRIDSGDWSLGGAHTLTLQVSGSGNVTISQTSSASLTLKNGVTVLAASSCENNINLLNIENATLATSSGKRFHNGWNGGSELAGGATINVRDGGTLSVYEFVPSPSQNAADAGIYRVNVATGGVFQLDHVLQQYNIDTTRYSTLYFDGGTLEGFPGASGKQFDRPSKTLIRLGLGGMRIAGDNHIYLRTEIASDTGVDGGILIDTSKMVFFCYGNAGLPQNSFTGPVRFSQMGGLLIINDDRNLGAVPSSPTNGVIFDTYGRILASDHDTVIDSNRNILINSNAVAVLAANGCSLSVAGTVSGNSSGSRRNGTLNTSWEAGWLGTLSLLPPAGRTNSFGRLIVKLHDLTIGGEGVTEITDTLDSIGHTGDDGVFSVMSGATLNVTNGLVRVMTNNYSIVDGGNLNVSGGVLDLSRQQLFVNACDGPATTTVSRAGTFIVNKYCAALRQMNPDSAVTRLQTGGTLVFNEFYMNITDGKMLGRARLEFDGGVLAPQTATRWFLGDSQEWYTNIFCVVKEGGAVISNNVEIWTHRPFTSGATQDGGLHKWGEAKLAIITTENSFNGPIEVHQGQLVWGNANNYFSTATLITHDGGIADINTYAQTLARVEGDGVVKQCNNLTVTGAVAPGFGAGKPGTLNFWHRCTFDDCALEIDAGDKLCVNENQDISGLTLNINDESSLNRNQIYTILGTVSDGDFVGEFKGSNIQNQAWHIHYDHVKHEVYLKYHPGTKFIFR